jgi:mannosyltransferase OCH1-like enzyme
MSNLTIHQIWLQGIDKIPEKYIQYMKSITKHNQKYKHKIWSEEIFYNEILNLSESKTFLNTYKKLTLIHLKVDYIRYIILYIFGGIYIDMDVEMVKSFDNVLYLLKMYDCILDKLDYGNIQSLIISDYLETINNGIIIVKYPHNIFIKKMIESCDDLIEKNKENILKSIERTHGSTILINDITGPKNFTNVYNKLSDSEKKKIFVSSDLFCTGECNYETDKLIIKHYSDITWFGPEYYYITKLYMSKEKIGSLCILLLLSSIISFTNGHKIENYINRLLVKIVSIILILSSVTCLVIKFV